MKLGEVCGNNGFKPVMFTQDISASTEDSLPMLGYLRRRLQFDALEQRKAQSQCLAITFICVERLIVLYSDPI